MGKVFFVLSFWLFCFGANAQELDSLQKVSSIEIVGLKKTKEQIIFREIPFKVGDTFTIETINGLVEQAKINIKNLNLFVTVDSEVTSSHKNEVEVKFIVKENWHLYVLPTFFLADRNFNEWWYERDRDLSRVTYGLTAVHYNLTGNRDKLKLKFHAGFVPSYEISYSRPYINKAKTVGFATSINYTKNRAVAYRTYEDKLDFFDNEQVNKESYSAALEFNYRKNLYSIHRLGAIYSTTQISDTLKTINPNYLENGSKSLKALSLYYMFSYDKRDSRQYPLKGHYAGFTALNTTTNAFNLVKLYGIYSHFYKISNNLYGQSSVKATLTSSKKQPYLYTSALGYSQSQLNGYELYVIDGQHMFVNNNKLKYKIFDKTFDFSKYIKNDSFNTIPLAVYLTGLLDMGYVKNYNPELSNTYLGNKFLVGEGIGIDMVSWYNTVFSLNYSFNNRDTGKFFIKFARNLDAK